MIFTSLVLLFFRDQATTELGHSMWALIVSIPLCATIFSHLDCEIVPFTFEPTLGVSLLPWWSCNLEIYSLLFSIMGHKRLGILLTGGTGDLLGTLSYRCINWCSNKIPNKKPKYQTIRHPLRLPPLCFPIFYFLSSYSFNSHRIFLLFSSLSNFPIPILV